MTEKELLQKIMSNIYGSDYEKKVFYDYISGETDYEPNQYNFKIYSCSLEFNDYEEHKNIVTRFFTSLSKKMPDKLLYIMKEKDYRYKMYYYINLEKSFLKKDILKKENISKIRLSLKSTKDFYENMYSELSLYYGDLLDEIINNCLNYQDESKFFTASIFFAYKINLHDKFYIDKINNLETIVYTLLNKAFSKENIQYTLNNYIDDREVIEYYNNFVPLNIKITSCYDAQDLLFFICNLCFKESKLIKLAGKISAIIFPPNYMDKKKGNDKIKDILELMDLYEVPEEVHLKYCVYKLFSSSNSFFSELINKKEIIEFINSILKKSFNNYINILNTMIEKDEIYFIPLYSILLKEYKDNFNKFDFNYYIEKAENIIIEKANEAVGFLKVKYSDEDNINFNLLKNENFDYTSVIGIISYMNEKLKFVFLSSMSILDYSKVAQRFVTVILNLIPDYTYTTLNFFQNYDLFNNNKNENTYNILFNKFDIPFEIVLKTYLLSCNCKQGQKIFDDEENFISFLKLHKTKAEESISNSIISNSVLVDYLNVLYRKDNGFDLKNIVKAFERKNKSVSECIEKIVLNKEEQIRPLIENLVNEKSKIISDTSVRLIRRWDNEKIEEKLNKINSIDKLMKYIEKLYTKNNDKYIPYLNEINYNCVRIKDSNKFVCEKLIKFYISEYIMLKEIYIIKICQKIQEFLNLNDLRDLLKSIIQMWISEGLSVKYKNIILPFCLISDESHVEEIKEQIYFFTLNRKPSFASFIVKSLCLTENKVFLSLVDSISKKYRNSKVRKAAAQAIEMTASRLGITKEELDDLIISNLDFDKNGDRYFSYGKRNFRVHIDENLKISIFNGDKKISSLPKASKKFNDDENLELKAKEQLKYIRKQLSFIFKYQKDKIFNYIISCRKWKKDNWTEVFINNPIMKPFAINLIWEELDKSNNIIKTFRYMEDGTFNTSDEEEYKLNDNSFIMLLHPADIDKEELSKWKQQLEDYEIIQPVEQISIPIYNINNENKLKTSIDLFKKTKFDRIKFKNRFFKYNMKSYFDNNNYNYYSGCIYTDINYNIVFIINTIEYYCESESDYKIEIEQIKFFDFIKEASFYESGTELMIKDVPIRLLSFSIFTVNSIIEETLK